MNQLIPNRNLLISIGFFMLVCLMTISTHCIAQTNMVGSLGGEVNVSPTGVATYSIPIEVVPGTNGMQPNLSITYNSASGRGMMGIGWSLSGLSSISRTQRNNFFDSAIGSVNYDGNDRFVLDGERLIKLSGGNYATTNAVYGTEIENFARVTLKGTPNDTSQYFIAVTEQGQIVEYGHTRQSKLCLPQGGILSWMVNKVTDADGNYMTVSYGKNWNTGEIWPLKIRYTGNETTGLSTYAKLEFQYIEDPYSNKTYIGGNTVTTTKLLKKIVVKYGSEVVRQYDFEYDFDRNSRLTAVRLQDGNGNNLTSTIVNWGNDQVSASYYTINGISDCGKHVMDFNGDNIPDLLLTSYDNGVCQWNIKQGDSNGGYQSTNYCGNIGTSNPVFIVDYDGDGRDGFGYLYHEGNTDDYIFKVRDMDNNSLVEKFSRTLQYNQFLMGDFLGQGGSQFVFVGKPVNQHHLVSNSFNNIGFYIPTDCLLSVTDLNGNGKADIQVVRENYIDVYEYNEQSGMFEKILDSHWLPNNPIQGFHGDFNGDGMIDYVFFTYSDHVGHWHLTISKGTGYRVLTDVPFNTTLLEHHITPKFSLKISDINGDGKDDIIQPSYTVNGPLTLNVYYSRCFDTTYYMRYDTTQIHNHGILQLYTIDYQFADFNHDGKNELFSSGYVFQNPVVISFPERREHDLVASVTNGFGKTTSLEYKYCNTPMFCNLGIDGKHIHYPLVSKLRQPDGVGGIDTTTFTYGDAVFDHVRQQFLGFGYQKTSCNGTNTLLEFEYNDTIHHLMQKHALTYYLSGNGNESGGYNTAPNYWHTGSNQFYYFETVNTLGYQGLDYGRFIPYYRVTSNINRLEGKTVTVSYWLNLNGRVSKTSSEYKSAKIVNHVNPWISRDSTVYTYTNVILPNGNTVVKPSTVKTWNKRKGYNQTPFRHTAYTYSSGRLVKDSIYDSDGAVGVTSYTYNNYGLPITETYTPNGMTAATKSFVYDNKGRFLKNETDVLGHTRSLMYDGSTGLMTQETDVNDLTTQYQYDALGRLTRIIRPDQTVHNTSYHWNNNSEFPLAVYYTMETEAGTPVTKTYYDIHGRAIHTYCEGQGYNDIVYDNRGRVLKQTFIPYVDPSTATNSKTWHYFEYDNFNRVLEETCPYTNLAYSYYEDSIVSHHHYFVSVVDKIRETRRTKTYDALGRLISAADEGDTIRYSYAYETMSGKTRDKMTISIGNDSTIIVSDIRGNRLSIQDPDAGTVTNTYNALNQLAGRTDANNNKTYYTYDIAGRTIRTIYEKNDQADVVIYNYDDAHGKGIGKLSSVYHNGDVDCTYSYDALGRLCNYLVQDGNTEYEHLYQYDTLGRLEYLTYPDGFQIKHTYNNYGELFSICNADDNSLIYSVETRNAFRQPLICRFGNETGTQYSYNSYGMLTGIRNGNTVEQGNVVNGGLPGDPSVIHYFIGSQYRNLTYTYDERGFIETKTDANVQQSETYYYDELDRLTSYDVNGLTAATFDYGNNGNITANSNVGDYSYDGSKPHAVTTIEGNSRCAIPPMQGSVSYNLRNRPATLSQSGYYITLDYDASGMRRHTEITNGNTLVKEKTRISKMYEMDATLLTSRRLDYIYAEGRIVAVHVDENSTESLYYVLTDHLGSWEKVLDESKTVVQQTHFDPWGNRMSYSAWDTPQTQTTFTFDRGFTGHEHYDCIRVINANARLYDPIIGRFFSPDPFVQAPDFTQAYNRYSYCMNNPVMYCDEDGEFIVVDSWIIGFLSKFVETGSLKQSLNEANKRATNDARIWGGLFVTDPNKGFWGRVGEITSRLTWQLPQTILGWYWSQAKNLTGEVDRVDYFGGATFVINENRVESGTQGATISNYINIDTHSNITDDFDDYILNNQLYMHEYGHYIQSQRWGPLYLLSIAIPSGISQAFDDFEWFNHNHDYFYSEVWANRNAKEYFENNYGYKWNELWYPTHWN